MVQTIERCDRILRIAAHSPGGVKLNDIAEQMELKYWRIFLRIKTHSLLRNSLTIKASHRTRGF